MDEPIHRITVLVDRSGAPLGGALVTDYMGPMERTLPLNVGPFDEPHEVVAEALRRLDVQLTLW